MFLNGIDQALFEKLSIITNKNLETSLFETT